MKLDDKWRIIYDADNTILQFHEQRTRVKKDGSEEEYEYCDSYYYPTLKSDLKSYLNKSLTGNISVPMILSRIDFVEKRINDFIN